MATKTFVSDGTAHKEVKAIYVSDGTTFRPIQNAWVSDGAAWRLVFQYQVPPVVIGGVLLEFNRTSPLNTSGSEHIEADVSYTLPSNATICTYRFTNGSSSTPNYNYTGMRWVIYKNGVDVWNQHIPRSSTANAWCGTWHRYVQVYSGPHICNGADGAAINTTVDITAGPGDVIRLQGYAFNRFASAPIEYSNFWGRLTRVS